MTIEAFHDYYQTTHISAQGYTGGNFLRYEKMGKLLIIYLHQFLPIHCINFNVILLESGVSDGQHHTSSSSKCDSTICLTVKCSFKNEVCNGNSRAQMLCDL